MLREMHMELKKGLVGVGRNGRVDPFKPTVALFFGTKLSSAQKRPHNHPASKGSAPPALSRRQAGTLVIDCQTHR